MNKLLNVAKVAVIAIALGSALNAAPLMAAPAAATAVAGINIEYYSDATYTDLVGGFVRNCHGIYRWGQVTEFEIVSYDEPC